MLHDSFPEATPEVPPVSGDQKDPFIGERWEGFPAQDDGQEPGHDAKVAYLTDHFDTLYVEDFVRVGLQVGAERMDARLMEKGREPVHAAIVTGILSGDRMKHEMYRGREDSVPKEFPTLQNKEFPTEQNTGAPFWYRQVIRTQLGPELLNPAMLTEATSIPGRKAIQPLGVILDSFVYRTMRDQQWPPKLVAMMAALGIHHAAVRNARQSVRPVLGKEASEAEEGREKAFWTRKLFGAKTSGAFYALGYLEKTQARLGEVLRDEWKGDYAFNRRVLVSALLMRSSVTHAGLGHGQVGDVRRPIFQAINDGYLDAADDKLKKAARKHPHLFTRLERQRLLRKNAPMLEEDADEKFE